MSAITHPVGFDPLIAEAKERARRRRLLALGAVVVVAAAVGTTYGVRSSGNSRGVCVTAPPGWRTESLHQPGVVPTLRMTNFAFGRPDYVGGHDDPKLHWPAGGILISIGDWTGAATPAMRSAYPPIAGSLRVRARSFSSFEGVRNLGQLHVSFQGRLLEVWVQARPTTPSTIAAANRALAGVGVCSA